MSKEEKAYFKTRPLVRKGGDGDVHAQCEDALIDSIVALTAIREKVASNLLAKIGTKGRKFASTSEDHSAIDLKDFIKKFDKQDFPLDSGIVLNYLSL